MAKYHNEAGELVDVQVPAQIYSAAQEANLSVPAYINRQYPTDSARFGTTFDQMLASTGLIVPTYGAQSEYGLRAPSMSDVLSGKAGFLAASNTAQVGTPNGQQSRTLFPAALIAYMETSLVKDYDTDADQFDKLIGLNISVAQDTFEQPLVNMNTVNGPQQARAQRRAQLAPPAAMMSFTTSDKIRKIPTYALGMEFSKEALRATTLDMVGMSVRRFLAVERDSWINSYLSDVYAGDLDINTGALTAITSNSLDSAATGGVLTQKAWLKFLWRNRKYRKIDWIVCDIDTYLKIEARTGRPSLTAIDTSIPRLEAQAKIVNNVLGEVNVFIVDSAADGGPLPANTILGLDSRYALVRVRNTAADVTASENYAMRQAEAFSLQFGEIVYRMNDGAFEVLTIS